MSSSIAMYACFSVMRLACMAVSIAILSFPSPFQTDASLSLTYKNVVNTHRIFITDLFYILATETIEI